MISVDTNVLARFYCDDPSDPEAGKQRPAARRLVLGSKTLFVPVTVVLELEWVMRGFYGLGTAEVCGVFEHLLGMPTVTVERWEAVKDAVDLARQGIDFADALHLATSRACEAFATFDKALARSAMRTEAVPGVSLVR